jgi:outer membrane protein assembly factor BamB
MTVGLFLAISTIWGADWLQFRGPNHNGVVSNAVLPTKWSDTDAVAWKADLPGRGVSGPIVVGNLVFLTASQGYRDDQLLTLCFDAKTGKQKWKRTIRATGRVSCHEKMCMATPTNASDGKRVVSFYSCNDVACFDLEGNLLWVRGLNYDYPNASNTVGMSSSPVIVEGVVVLQVENQAESFACGLDVETGENIWKIDRPAESNWTSPVVIDSQKGKQVLLQSAGKLTAVEPRTGKTVWEYTAACSAIPSVGIGDEHLLVPVMKDGLVIMKKNVVSQSPEILWKLTSAYPNTPSPIVVGQRSYTVTGPGLLACVDLTNGKLLWKERLKGPFSSTPVVAGDLMYLFNEDGQGHVVRLKDKNPEILAVNNLKETILASPAIADDALYIRSDKHLWKISAKK